MSATIKITSWLLMIVMHSGTLSTAQFPSEALCRDGESLSLYGKTVAEKATDDMKWRVREQVDKALWDLDHPRRTPANAGEREAVIKAKAEPDHFSADKTMDGKEHDNPWPRTVYIKEGDFKVFDDGTVQQRLTYSGLVSSTTSNVSVQNDWVTATRCVPVPEEAK